MGVLAVNSSVNYFQKITKIAHDGLDRSRQEVYNTRMKNKRKGQEEMKKTSKQKSTEKWAKRKARWNAWKAEQAKAQAEEMMLERSREER